MDGDGPAVRQQRAGRQGLPGDTSV
jgi:hypothetical protein